MISTYYLNIQVTVFEDSGTYEPPHLFASSCWKLLKDD